MFMDSRASSGPPIQDMAMDSDDETSSDGDAGLDGVVESESESEFDAAVAADLGTTRQEGRRARRGQSALAAGDSGDECIFDTADASPTAPSGTRKRLAAKRRRVVESESESEDESEAEDNEGLMDLSAEEEFVSVDDAEMSSDSD